MSFLIKHKKLLEKSNKIWGNIITSIKKQFDGKPVNNENYLETKMKSCKSKLKTIFHKEEIPPEGSPCVCLFINDIN